jgi:hypothetical protein
VGIKVAAEEEGFVGGGKSEEVTKVGSFVYDVVIIVDNDNGGVRVEAKA